MHLGVVAQVVSKRAFRLQLVGRNMSRNTEIRIGIHGCKFAVAVQWNSVAAKGTREHQLTHSFGQRHYGRHGHCWAAADGNIYR